MTKTIRFDRSLYLPDAVTAAAAAYAELATIETEMGADATTASISVDGEDLDVIAHAFSNHVLHETILRTRQAAHAEVL